MILNYKTNLLINYKKKMKKFHYNFNRYSDQYMMSCYKVINFRMYY